MLGAPPEARPSSGVQLFRCAGFLTWSMEDGHHTPGPAHALASVARTMLKLLMLAAGLVCVLAFGWWLYCQHQNEVGRSEWARVKADLEAKGEQLDWASFIPEPVADADSFMRTPFMEGVVYRDSYDPILRRRLTAIDAGSLTTHMRTPDDPKPSDLPAMARTLRMNLAPGRQWASTNVAAMIIEWMQPLEADFAELRAAARLPYSQLRLAATNAAAPYLPNFVAVRVLAQQFGVLAAAHLEAGQSQLALDDLRVNLALSRALEDQGLLVSYMIAVAIDGLTIGPIVHGLRARRWNDEQLVELDRMLATIDLPAKFPQVIRSERAAANERFGESLPLRIIGPVPAGPLTAWEEKLSRFRPEGWVLGAQAMFNEFMEVYVPLYDPDTGLAHKPALMRLNERAEELATSWHPRDRFAASMIPNFSRAFETVAKHQTWINQARLAIAIERYRLKHERLPAALPELVPVFIAKLPHDLIGGEPLRYRRLTDEHFLLWSVGWNEVDEDGTVAEARDEGDWVWFGL